ncbi:hypothetical protein [Bdellovibrio sp. NC01]|uniref:hypothetical protein n=1 Tax=Bdellovibrio sp. NC01 TaxID=2220073 RepID=UPI0011599E90|nr:hypothetical protein [Bdellovibrio sp. NC01]QDK37942.1 hypothetical protein DOE51_10265 [Bdellovibrio sp. NC01]
MAEDESQKSRFDLFLEAAKNTAITSGHKITTLTQVIDHSFKATEMSRWMDISSTGAGFGGRFHRVFHGHDFVSNFPEVVKRFGLKKALTQYPFEIFKDASTPDGVPLPGMQTPAKNNVITPKQAGTWGSQNLGKALGGAAAIYGSYSLYKNAENGDLVRPSVAILATVGVVTKVTAGVVTANPVILASGVADVAIMTKNKEHVKIAFNEISVAVVAQGERVKEKLLPDGLAALTNYNLRLFDSE